MAVSPKKESTHTLSSIVDSLVSSLVTLETLPRHLFVWIKAMRPHQWIKNFLLFLPPIFAHRFSDLTLYTQAFFGFLAFSFAASAIYIINDLVDVRADQAHPEKRKRPIASGQISTNTAILLVLITLTTSALAAYELKFDFALYLIAYVLVSNLYTFVLKKIEIVDVITLVTLFAGRLLAGGAATNTEVSLWFLTFAGFFFLSLAFVKRYTELLYVQENSIVVHQRRGYSPSDSGWIQVFGVVSGFAAVLVLIAYLGREGIDDFYPNKEVLWGNILILFYWINRVWLLASRKEMPCDPILFVLKDKLSWYLLIAVVLLWGSAFAL